MGGGDIPVPVPDGDGSLLAELVLVERLMEVHGVLYDYSPALTDQDLIAFLQAEYARVGTNSHITPREIIRDFIEVLDILMQSPEMKVSDLLGSESFTYAKNPVEEEPVSDQFAEFEL